MTRPAPKRFAARARIPLPVPRSTSGQPRFQHRVSCSKKRSDMAVVACSPVPNANEAGTHKERRLDVACCRVRCPQRIRSHAAMGTPLGTADTIAPQLVDGSDDHQTFADLDWLRLATRKSLQPLVRQCLA